jgi:ABC-2 type transport system permease protein
MIYIIKKELHHYFTSLIGYLFISFFVLISAVFLVIINLMFLDPNYTHVLVNTLFALLIIVPVLTMRTFSEETRQKTDQLLFTSPLTITQIVVGKYIGLVIIFSISLGITVIFPIILSFFGNIPTAHITTAFIGYLLLTSAFISIGVFTSTLSDSQIISAIICFCILFFIYILEPIVQLLPTSRGSSLIFIAFFISITSYSIYRDTKNKWLSLLIFFLLLASLVITFIFNSMLFYGLIPTLASYFALVSRYDNFYLGLLSLADIVYYLSIIIFFIYLTIKRFERKKWKQ